MSFQLPGSCRKLKNNLKSNVKIHLYQESLMISSDLHKSTGFVFLEGGSQSQRQHKFSSLNFSLLFASAWEEELNYSQGGEKMKRTSEATLKTLKRGKLSFPLIKHTAAWGRKQKQRQLGKPLLPPGGLFVLQQCSSVQPQIKTKRGEWRLYSCSYFLL